MVGLRLSYEMGGALGQALREGRYDQGTKARDTKTIRQHRKR